MKLIIVRQKLYKRLDKLRNDKNYSDIIKEISNIPEDKLDYDLIIHLADAYLHTYKYREAINSLLSVSEEGIEDYVWHFMIGQAYYFTDDMAKVEEEIGKAFELNSEGDYASDFVEYCHFHYYVKLHLDKLAERFVSRREFLPEYSFTDRVTSFWNWFCENELKLSELSENCERYPSEITSFISEGMDSITNDVDCILEKDFKLTFVLNSNSYLFYLLPYLISKAPQQIQDKWHISISASESRSLRASRSIYGILIEEVKLTFNYDPKSNKFDLYYYSEDFLPMEVDEANMLFSKMLKVLLSENILRLYINTVAVSHAPTDDMFSALQLSEKLSNTLKLYGKEMIENPSNIRVAYTFTNADTDKLRYDIISGSTSLLDSVAEYHSDVRNTYMNMENSGAKLVYLFYVWPMEMDRNRLFDLRYDFEDYLIEEILGEKGSSREIGISLGSAGGSMYEYIDLLIYDMPEFFKRIDSMLKNYQFGFYLSDFCPDGKIIKLNTEVRL